MTSVQNLSAVCEARVPIELDRPRVLIFNFNTVRMFESVARKRYWAFVASIFTLQAQVLKDATDKWMAEHPGEPIKAEEIRFNNMDVLAGLDMEQLQTLVWAALHVYDKNNKAKWPLTLDEVGRCFTPIKIIEAFRAVLQGISQNNPTPAELGEASAPDGASETPAPAAIPTTPATPADSGGTTSTALPAAAFD